MKKYILGLLILLGMTDLVGQKQRYYKGGLMCDMAEPVLLDKDIVGIGAPSRNPSTDFPFANLCFGVGVPHNLVWYKFVTPVGGDIVIEMGFDPSQCETGQGIQAGILTDCTSGEAVDCNANCNTSSFRLSFASERGEDYFLWADGCNADVCEFRFDLLVGDVLRAPDRALAIGSLYADQNESCQDEAERPLYYGELDFVDSSGERFTSLYYAGFNSLFLPEATYTVLPSHSILEYDFCPDRDTIRVDSTLNVAEFKFGAQPVNCGELALDILPLASGFSCFTNINRRLNLVYSNVGDLPIPVANVTVSWDTLLTVFDIDIPHVLTDDSLMFTLIDVPPGSIDTLEIDFEPLCTEHTIGETICISAKTDQVFCPSLNSETAQSTYCDEIRAAWDPNDISVSPIGITINRYIEKSQELEYTVRFQNTGNDTARDVTVDVWLDGEDGPVTYIPNSFQAVSRSHPVALRVDYPNYRNLIRFKFLNINLVDSATNEAASHGFVKFRLQLSDDTPLLSKVNHQAAIYFNLAPAVWTNVQKHTISAPYIVEEEEVGICTGETFRGKTINNDTIFRDTFSLEGPDSIHVQHVEALEVYESEIDTIMNIGDKYRDVEIDGDTFIQEFYVAQNGCDSIINVNIMVPTSTDEVENRFISVYPNPLFDQDLIIQFQHPNFNVGTLTLFNIAGQVCHVTQLNRGGNTIKSDDLCPGLMLFQVTTGDGIVLRQGKIIR